MKRNPIFVLTVCAALMVVLWLTTTVGADRLAGPAAPQPGAPTVVSYQGQVIVSGTPYSGAGYFKFAVVNQVGDVAYWSNDGSSSGGSQPTLAISLTVTKGLFSVLLGDTSLTNMTQALSSAAFTGADRYLRVWFSSDGSSFTLLSPDRRIAAVPYALRAEKEGNLIIVAKSGGDFTSIQAALNSITDASGTNRYLVRVGPGVYTEQVTMRQYVDIEGSGELATKITGTGGASSSTGTVVGASNAELRFLTVENTGGTSYAKAIYNSYAALRLTQVTASASGGGLTTGVYNSAASPTMQNVTASASGGTYNYAVYNSAASPTMRNVTASASGGTSSVGVVNLYSSSPTMQDVTASASGGGWTTGVYNFESSPTMQNSSLSASGGTSNYGVYNDGTSGSFTVHINNSQVITASTATIFNNAYFTTLVGASQLAGGAVTGGGTIICAGVYDGNYAPLGSNCLKGRTVLVSPVGTATQNGTALLNALAGISGATTSNTYLLKIEPGLYDVGTSPLTMKPYVDIEGSGESATKITGTGSASSNTGTVVGASNAELRFLTVANTGGDASAIAIFNGSAAPRLTHVSASASGATNNHGVFNSSSSPTMQDITASASGGNESYGVFNASNSSPTMQDVAASASGGTWKNAGVLNSASSPTMRDVTASASGGTNFNYGVLNDSSSPTMQDVTANASGGTNNYGVYNYESSPTIQNSSLSASGGTSNYGVYNEAAGGTHTVRINNSQVTASTATISSDAYFTTLVGASLLAGDSVTGGGTIICAGVYNQKYTFYASECP